MRRIFKDLLAAPITWIVIGLAAVTFHHLPSRAGTAVLRHFEDCPKCSAGNPRELGRCDGLAALALAIQRDNKVARGAVLKDPLAEWFQGKAPDDGDAEDIVTVTR
jgi:hypothetical protein